jgi:hypothetical protein
MIGSGYVQDVEKVNKEMSDFDSLSIEERLAKGRSAYEEVRWNKRTSSMRAISWMALGGLLYIFISYFSGALK